eukprot:TRINITY_DN14637_c0_g1_i1.p2 TRINITY_DN14637_c0_g1~~TRINITY_DN14637_c0_g1_i1.p2  ORF type:complete len:304 (+),score=65.57 TRINITY_DN14637_c0_g1_i1:119-1030(+)
MRVVIEREGAEDHAMAVDAQWTVGELAARAHAELALPGPAEAYVLWRGEEAMDAARGVEEYGVEGAGERVYIAMGDVHVARARLRQEGISEDSAGAALQAAVGAADVSRAALLVASGWLPPRKLSAMVTRAAGCGDGAAVRCLLDAGVRLDGPQAANPCLVAAARKEHWDIARSLVERGADVRARDMNGDTCLHVAAGRGAWDMVRFFVSCGADASAVGFGKATLATIAARQGAWKEVQFALAHGADVNAEDAGRDTCLTLAVRQEEWDVARTLVSSGADPAAVRGTQKWNALKHLDLLDDAL